MQRPRFLHPDCSTGVGFDYYRGQVFFSDTTGGVYVKEQPDGPPGEEARRAPQDGVRLLHQSDAEPRALSVDWLHHKLYIAENNKVGGGFVRTTNEQLVLDLV